MPIYRKNWSSLLCVYFYGNILVTGVIDGTETSVEAYDHYLKRWMQMPNLTEEKYRHETVAIGNKFHAIGGNTQHCEVSDKFS